MAAPDINMATYDINKAFEDGVPQLKAYVVQLHRSLKDQAYQVINDNQGADKGTLLHKAVRMKCYERIELLIKYGANVNKQCIENGDTPLHVASFLGHEEAVKKLLYTEHLDNYRQISDLCFSQGVCKCGLKALKVRNWKGRKPVTKTKVAISQLLNEEEILCDVRNNGARISKDLYERLASQKEDIDVSKVFYDKLMVTAIEVGNMNLLAFVIFKITEAKNFSRRNCRRYEGGVTRFIKMLKGNCFDNSICKQNNFCKENMKPLTRDQNCVPYGSAVKDAISNTQSRNVSVFIHLCHKVLMGEGDLEVSDDIRDFLAAEDNIRLVLSATSNVDNIPVKKELLEKLISGIDDKEERFKIDWSGLDMKEGYHEWFEPFTESATELNLSKNRLLKIPSKILDFRNLCFVNFSNNKLTNVPLSIFELQFISHIDLSHNSIKQLPDKIIFSNSLLTLSLNKNFLVNLPESMGRSVISVLNLAYNKFESLPYCLFEMPMLQHLELDGNDKMLWFPNEIGKMRSDISISLKDMDQLRYHSSLLQAENTKKLLLHHRHKIYGTRRKKQMNLILIGPDEEANSKVFNRLCPSKENLNGYHLLANKGVLKRNGKRLIVVKVQEELTFRVAQCYLTEPQSLYFLVWNMDHPLKEALTSLLNTLVAFNPNGNVMIIGVGTVNIDMKQKMHNWLTRRRRYSSLSFGAHGNPQENQWRIGEHWFVMLDDFKTTRFTTDTLKNKIFAVATSLKDSKNNDVILGNRLPSFYFEVSKRILNGDNVVIDQRRLLNLIKETKSSQMCGCFNSEESPTLHLRDLSEIVMFMQEQGILVNFQKSSGLDDIFFHKHHLYNRIQDYTGNIIRIGDMETLDHYDYKPALHQALQRKLEVFQIVQGSGWGNVTFTNIDSLYYAMECIALDKQPETDEVKEFHGHLCRFAEDTFHSSDKVDADSQVRSYGEIRVFHFVKNFVEKNVENPIGLAHCRFHIFKVVPLQFWLDLLSRVIKYMKWLKWLSVEETVNWKYGICFKSKSKSEMPKLDNLFIELTCQVRLNQCYISCKVVTDNREKSEILIADVVDILITLIKDWTHSKKSGLQLNENGIEQYAICLHHLDTRHQLIPSCLYNYLQHPGMLVDCPYKNHTLNPKEVVEIFPDYGLCNLSYAVVKNANMPQVENDNVVYTITKENCMEIFYQFRKDVLMYTCVCNHPNIISVHKIRFDGKNRLEIVMESVPNQWSSSFWNGKQDSLANLRICYQLASALEHLHGLDIVHQNINPSNLKLYGNSDDISIKIVNLSEASHFTANGLQFRHRNPVYQPPEILIQKLDCSKPVDIWSYGMVVYQLLTGRLPFSESNQTVIEHLKSGGKPVFPLERRKNLPLNILVKMCWEYNPMMRPSASDVSAILRSTCFQLLMDVTILKGEEDFNTLLPLAGIANGRLVMMCHQQLYLLDISEAMVPKYIPISQSEFKNMNSFCEIDKNILAFCFTKQSPVSYNILILKFNDHGGSFKVLLSESYKSSFIMFCGIGCVHLFFQGGLLKKAVIRDGALDRFSDEDLPELFVERFKRSHDIKMLNELFVSVYQDSEKYWNVSYYRTVDILKDGFHSWLQSQHLILVNTSNSFCLLKVDNQTKKVSVIHHDDSFDLSDDFVSAFLVIDHNIFWIGTNKGRIMICRYAEKISMLKMIHPYRDNVTRLILMMDQTNKPYVISYARQLNVEAFSRDLHQFKMNRNFLLENGERTEECSDLLLLWNVYNEDQMVKLPRMD